MKSLDINCTRKSTTVIISTHILMKQVSNLMMGGVIWQQKIDRRLPSELYVAINLQGIYFVHTTTKVDIKLIIILTCCDHFGWSMNEFCLIKGLWHIVKWVWTYCKWDCKTEVHFFWKEIGANCSHTIFGDQ